MEPGQSLEAYFDRFRENVIGMAQSFESPHGTQKMLYADWTAGGRAYQPVEDHLQNILPFMANTHTGSTATGKFISQAYEETKVIIKRHVNAGDNDLLVYCGSGMTAAVNKLQRILGLRIPERLKDYMSEGCITIDEHLRPVIFITHMEHHSNHTSWLETIATVEIIDPDKSGKADLQHFELLLKKYEHRPNKIAAVTACSNVTGIETPYHEIAKMIHRHNGLCFVDFACSAPYVDMDMHPEEPDAHLDAIYFSPHKFLGGPGTPGVLIFNNKFYTNKIPEQPGGGTVAYSSPWQKHTYVDDIEQREDGGTPPILQAIKAAQCIRLKEAMGTDNIRKRERQMLTIILAGFNDIKNAIVLEGHTTNRLGVVSFMIKGAHYNLIVKLLNDRFGIQTRGGCSCAGTYGHYLLKVSRSRSNDIRHAITAGDLQNKPGWIRLSVHPVMSDNEMHFIMNAIRQTADNHHIWKKDYIYDAQTNEYIFSHPAIKIVDAVTKDPKLMHTFVL